MQELHVGQNVYLSNPYSNDDKKVVLESVGFLATVFGMLMQKKVNVISPVLMGHAAIEHGAEISDLTWNYWQDYCKSLMKACTVMYVLDIPGHETSIGVGAEILLARTMKIPVFLLNITTLEITSYKS